MFFFRRAAALVAVAITIHVSQTWWLARHQPDFSTRISVREVHHHNATVQQWFGTEELFTDLLAVGAISIATTVLFGGPVCRLVRRSQRAGLFD